MRALSIAHHPDAGPGVFADAIRSRGWEHETWMAPAEPAPSIEAYRAVLVFGGAMNVDQQRRYPWLAAEKEVLRDLVERRVPILGVCLGSQLLAEAAGASPRRASEPEIGWREVALTPEGRGDPVVGPLEDRFEALQWHSYEAPLPPGATALARSPVCLQAYRLDGSSWGIQFHAEVALANFESWIANYQSDPDAVRIGLDAERFRAETRDRITAWNRLGAGLCGRFLDVVAGSRYSPQ